MRSAIAVAAFAANVLAAPYVKRDEVIVTDIDVVYATEVVTVYATGGAPTPDQTQAAVVIPVSNDFNGHWGHSWGGYSPAAESSSVSTPPPVAPTTTSTSVYVPPAAPTTTSVYVAPAPTSTPVYVAPPAPTTSTYVAPTSTWEPATTQAPAESWASLLESGAWTPTGTFADSDPVTWTSSAAYTAYSSVVLNHHNFHRSNHSAPMLSWNESLASSAQELANTCNYGHNTEMAGGGYGQNIAAGVDMNNVTAVITDLWYNGEEPWYNFNGMNPNTNDFDSWGHMSQIVWNTTYSVGCATSNCTAPGLGNVGGDVPPFFTVCNYYPAGNVAPEWYDINAPIGMPTIQWNAS